MNKAIIKITPKEIQIRHFKTVIFRLRIAKNYRGVKILFEIWKSALSQKPGRKYALDSKIIWSSVTSEWFTELTWAELRRTKSHSIWQRICVLRCLILFPLHFTWDQDRSLVLAENIELATFFECQCFQLAKLDFNSHFASLQAWVSSPAMTHFSQVFTAPNGPFSLKCLLWPICPKWFNCNPMTHLFSSVHCDPMTLMSSSVHWDPMTLMSSSVHCDPMTHLFSSVHCDKMTHLPSSVHWDPMNLMPSSVHCDPMTHLFTSVHCDPMTNLFSSVHFDPMTHLFSSDHCDPFVSKCSLWPNDPFVLKCSLWPNGPFVLKCSLWPNDPFSLQCLLWPNFPFVHKCSLWLICPQVFTVIQWLICSQDLVFIVTKWPVFQLGQNRRALRPSCPPLAPFLPSPCALLPSPVPFLPPWCPKLMSVVVWLFQALLSINLPV